jgi:hypothetical protein
VQLYYTTRHHVLKTGCFVQLYYYTRHHVLKTGCFCATVLDYTAPRLKNRMFLCNCTTPHGTTSWRPDVFVQLYYYTRHHVLKTGCFCAIVLLHTAPRLENRMFLCNCTTTHSTTSWKPDVFVQLYYYTRHHVLKTRYFYNLFCL